MWPDVLAVATVAVLLGPIRTQTRTPQKKTSNTVGSLVSRGRR